MAVLQQPSRTFGGEENQCCDYRWDHVEQTKGDSPSSVVVDCARASANGVDDKAANDETELVRTDNETACGCRDDFGLEGWDNGEFHAHVDVYYMLGEVSRHRRLRLDLQFKILAAMMWSRLDEVTAIVAVPRA